MHFDEIAPISFSLPNGIRVIHRSCYGSVSCCGFTVNAGTRHERANEAGIAHFTEHLLFKGTQNRRSHHILNRMETVGGELNAYTTKEETFIYSVFLENDYERALELLTDLFFHSTFPAEEIEKERDVILDEIHSYEDSPSELIFDDYEDLLFAHHPIGRKILGTPECLKTFNQDSFEEFYKRNYTTDRIVFFSQSPIPLKKWRKLIEKHLGQIVPGATAMPQFSDKPIPRTGFKEVIEKETHQSHVIYGNRNYEFSHPNRIGMYLLNNILGGPGMNSRLNVSLRERSGLVYSVESNVTSYTDSGLFTIYFGTDPEQTDRCLTLVEKELKKLREQTLTTLQLHAAQKQLFGQMMISSEQKENGTLTMGKSMLYFNKFDSMDEVAAKVMHYTPELLREIANEILDPTSMSMLIYK
ncbi:MAG TPA: pitrilysin family protein [Bacteroidales bacterium]|nr:pitrilysin family protein [Bacteroidales bacterium]